MTRAFYNVAIALEDQQTTKTRWVTTRRRLREESRRVSLGSLCFGLGSSVSRWSETIATMAGR
jgi:hypothetical protein